MSVVQAHRPIAVPRQIPVVLSVVAGYVDSCTYLGLFGVFVAQVTGSFVFAGASFISIEPGALAKLLAIARAATIVHFQNQRAARGPDVRWIIASVRRKQQRPVGSRGAAVNDAEQRILLRRVEVRRLD